MIFVRPFTSADAEPVSHIMAACTRELRQVYTPKPVPEPKAIQTPPPQQPNAQIVATDDAGTVIGVAEWSLRATTLYVQGLAVAPTHRQEGIAAKLLEHCHTLALEIRLAAIEVSTIKETGNVDIFQRLGFTPLTEQISQRYQGRSGQPVTEVSLRRRIA